MPIYEIVCGACGRAGEVLTLSGAEALVCPNCGSERTTKLMSPTSTMTGRESARLPGATDTACCGSAPGHAGCAGPGSCCGKTG